jgi:hypothetical protein
MSRAQSHVSRALMVLGLCLGVVSIVLARPSATLAGGGAPPCVTSLCIGNCIVPPCARPTNHCNQMVNPWNCGGCACIVDNDLPEACECL